MKKRLELTSIVRTNVLPLLHVAEESINRGTGPVYCQVVGALASSFGRNIAARKKSLDVPWEPIGCAIYYV